MESIEKKIAVLSIIIAVLHFAGETLWHFKFGQFLPMLIVDYIAVSLLIYGGIMTLKSNRAIGLLCGAWAFEFCLNYRALFWRIESLMSGAGIGDPAVDDTAKVLVVFLVFSVIIFLITVVLTNNNAKNNS